MKKFFAPVFPLLLAALTLVLFLLLYRPVRSSLEMTSACLVFLTTLGWSSLIVLNAKGMTWFKVFYSSTSLLVAVALVEFFRPFPVDLLQHRLMVALQAWGMACIVFYLHILKKKGESHHDR
jgi:hypothetical protein